MAILRTGDLIFRITIQAPVYTQGQDGEQVITWADEEQRWANIQPLTGREYLQAQAVQSSVSHRITIHYMPGLKTDHRITYDGRTFDIVSVIHPDEARVQTCIMAVEHVI